MGFILFIKLYKLVSCRLVYSNKYTEMPLHFYKPFFDSPAAAS